MSKRDHLAAPNPAYAKTQAQPLSLQSNSDAWTLAQKEGRLIASVPVSCVDANYLQRDRQVISIEDLEELKMSILENGMRMPIEVVKTGEEAGQDIYGLISGYRRLSVVRMLATEGTDPKWDQIKAIILPPTNARSEYVAMVEENEMRQELTNYERGRIVDLSVTQGVFASTDQALAKLFSRASKSKRSKIRSFAFIHNQLDGYLNFAHALRERNGLKLATALRNGKAKPIREALKENTPANREEEWALIEAAMRERMVKTPRPPVKIGRSLQVGYSGRPGRFKLEFSGREADDELRNAIISFLKARARHGV